MDNMKTLNYEDFGAIGDGKHDDLEAIIACHEEANRLGLPVKTKTALPITSADQKRAQSSRQTLISESQSFLLTTESLKKSPLMYLLLPLILRNMRSRSTLFPKIRLILILSTMASFS